MQSLTLPAPNRGGLYEYEAVQKINALSIARGVRGAFDHVAAHSHHLPAASQALRAARIFSPTIDRAALRVGGTHDRVLRRLMRTRAGRKVELIRRRNAVLGTALENPTPLVGPERQALFNEVRNLSRRADRLSRPGRTGRDFQRDAFERVVNATQHGYANHDWVRGYYRDGAWVRGYYRNGE